MQRYLVISILIFFTGFANGQERFGIVDFGTDSSKMAVGIYGGYHLGSTALTNRIYLDFLQGNFIERETLDKASKRLFKINRVGGDMSYGLFFSQSIDTLFGKTGFSYFVNIADRFHTDAVFTDDFFTVAFYGNKSFEDDTAVLGSFNANYLHYQQIQIGMIKTNTNNSILGFGASFLVGQEFFQLNIPRANLYTSALGMQNNLDIKYRTTESDPGKSSLGDMNGRGFSVDAFYQVPSYVLQRNEVEEGSWKGYVRIEASDIGIISWNDSSRTRAKDTIFVNEGIAFAPSSIWTEDQSDSLLQLVSPETTRRSFQSVLPGTIHLKMYQENATGLYLTMGTILRIFANYSPMIYLGGGKKIANKFHFGGALEFGGYGRFNLSVDAKIQVKGFEVALGSRSLGGIVFPKRAGGNSAYVSLKKKF